MNNKSVYRSRPIKRRTRRELTAVSEAIYMTLFDDHPATVRQVFYRLISSGVIDKTEGEYKNTVVRLLSSMRRSRVIPFDWIADNTRWQRKPRTYSSLQDALEMTAQFYRRALWDEQDTYVEIWLEKDALSSVLYEITARWDVPLMVTRGYPSLTFMQSAAHVIASIGKPTRIYYLGDYDPSGVNISTVIERNLREFAPDAAIVFERIAVTPAQIIAMNLPTRPTKKSDSRAKNFQGESVEVDAIPPRVLKDLVESRITDHVDTQALRAVETAEESERELLLRIAADHQVVN